MSSKFHTFRNIVITFPRIIGDEKLNKFWEGLKLQVRIRVLKLCPDNLNSATKIAINVDNALLEPGYTILVSNVELAMEIDNANVKRTIMEGHSNRKVKFERSKNRGKSTLQLMHASFARRVDVDHVIILKTKR